MKLSRQKAKEILKQYNLWRRSDYLSEDDIETPDPKEVGIAIDTAIEALKTESIAKELFDAIEFTIEYPNRENREKDDYEVSFLYPSNNLSYQKLLRAYNLYKGNPDIQALGETKLKNGFCDATIELTECCNVGPITTEKFCPECGKKIIR